MPLEKRNTKTEKQFLRELIQIKRVNKKYLIVLIAIANSIYS